MYKTLSVQSKKTSAYIASAVGCFLLMSQVHADFVEQNFRDTSAPGWTLSGSSELTAEEGIDPAGDGWLRLTPNLNNLVGKALYNDSFASTDGVVIKFDYAMWGRTGQNLPADGISFFLYDPSVANAMGNASNGAGLGYCNGDGGVLGVGLDSATGSFVRRLLDNTFCKSGYDYQLPNAITVRGPISTENAFIGTPIQLTELIYDADATTRPAQTRSIQLSMLPLGGNNGYYVTLDEGPTGGTPTRLIQGTYSTTLPDRLSIGFGGGTGAGTQVNEVRINSVSLPMNIRLTTTPPVQDGHRVTHTFTLSNQPLVEGGAAVPITNVSDAPLLSETTDPDLKNIEWTCTPSGEDTTCPVASGIGPIENLGNYLLGETGSLTFTVTGTVSCSTDSEQEHTVTAVFPSTSSFEDATPGDSIATAKGPVITSSCPAPTPVPVFDHLALVLLSLAAAVFAAIGLRRRTAKHAS